ncbi:hypothetical protein HaLaN_19252 [Haematococcus lacustris]|uniref:Uncharacterized protein n=1 Tax=Haematococcus lacustris TaxID=44745 RepID=A0A699ZIS2_HAELA|nr:hypothetical protein HaLaN_19252 [Haematococcus lacustris]
MAAMQAVQAFSSRLVEVSLWNTSSQVPAQYVDVLYAFGYYSCYTLSIDLTASGSQANHGPAAGQHAARWGWVAWYQEPWHNTDMQAPAALVCDRHAAQA